MNIVKKCVVQSGKNMSNKFCSYPVSDCQLSSLLASYKQRIDNLQTALGNLELDAILAEVQQLEDAKRIDELEREVIRWHGLFDEKHRLLVEEKAKLAKAVASLEHLVYLQSGNPCTGIQAGKWLNDALVTLTTLKGNINE
jgi:hypothetical protein